MPLVIIDGHFFRSLNEFCQFYIRFFLEPVTLPVSAQIKANTFIFMFETILEFPLQKREQKFDFARRSLCEIGLRRSPNDYMLDPRIKRSSDYFVKVLQTTFLAHKEIESGMPRPASVPIGNDGNALW